MLPYIKLFADLLETVEEMTDDEAGRLFKALLAYANGNPVQLTGAERYVFLMLKAQIDRDSEAYADKCRKLSANGKKAGHGKQLPPIAGNCTQEKEKDKEEEKDKEKDKEVVVVPPTPSAEIVPFDSPEVTGQRDELAAFIANSLSPMNADILTMLLTFRDSFSDELIRRAVNETLMCGSRSSKYAIAILNRWLKAGLKTAADIDAAEEKRKAALHQEKTGGGKMLTRDIKDEELTADYYAELIGRRLSKDG